MFNWLKRLMGGRPSEVSDVMQRMSAPLILAEGLRKSTHEYFQAVANGRVTAPAFKRQNASVTAIWEGTRYEAY